MRDDDGTWEQEARADLRATPRPRLLDGYCCAGGASMGYHRAGWAVEGVELYPRPDYPFTQHKGDAVAFIRDTIGDYDAYSMSPPCQIHTTLTKGNAGRGWTNKHVDLIAATRDALIDTGKPYIIENVVGARAELRDPVMLCGLSFGLRVFRHRLFESNVELSVPDHTSHRGHRVAGWRHGVKHEGDMFAVYALHVQLFTRRNARLEAVIGIVQDAIKDRLLCRCGCPRDVHVGEIGCPCGLPGEPPCAPTNPPTQLGDA